MTDIVIYYTKDTQRNASAKAKCYVTSTMRRELVRDVGFDGYTLFEHLLNRKSSKRKPLDDATLAEEVGFTNARALAKTRKKLESTHWFLPRKTKNIYEYFIGKKSVMEALFGSVDLPLQVKQMCRSVALTNLRLVDATEDTAAFLAEFEYLQTKAEQWVREAMDDDTVLHAIQNAHNIPTEEMVDQTTAYLCVLVGKMLKYNKMLGEAESETTSLTADTLAQLTGTGGINTNLTLEHWESVLQRFNDKLWHYNATTKVVTFLTQGYN